VTCKVTLKNGVVLSDKINLSFATLGSSGTDYTIMFTRDDTNRKISAHVANKDGDI